MFLFCTKVSFLCNTCPLNKDLSSIKNIVCLCNVIKYIVKMKYLNETVCIF